jgi:predicted acylesterase/phospholipase RssA
MIEPRRAMVLAGGGLKVSAQAGAMQVWLDEAGLRFDHADGCSGGTLNLAMYCAGLSGGEIADRWRSLRPLRLAALNWPGVLAGPWAPSLLSLARLRDQQLARWGLDWSALVASPRSAAFNVYDFTHHRLLQLSPADLTPDLLMACNALPGWYPPVRWRGSDLIDAVYATDANLADAISRGADELWVIWTVDITGRWRPGPVAAYFQTIETSANSDLRATMAAIEHNNAEIAAGGPGSYGRPITVRLLQIPSPVHYLFVFRRSSIRRSVAIGVDTARVWCRANGIPFTPLSPEVDREQIQPPGHGLVFHETMTGQVRFTASATAGHRGGLRAHRLSLRLRVAAADVQALIRDPQHRAQLSGSVVCEALGGTLPVRSGTVDLLTREGADELAMRYDLEVEDGTGHRLRLQGYKDVAHDRAADLWADTTTLPVTLTDVAGRVVVEGVVRLSLLGVLRVALSLRGSRSGIAGVLDAGRFVRFFAGALAWVYLRPSGMSS